MHGTHNSHRGKTHRHVTKLLTSIPIGGAKVCLCAAAAGPFRAPPRMNWKPTIKPSIAASALRRTLAIAQLDKQLP